MTKRAKRRKADRWASSQTAATFVSIFALWEIAVVVLSLPQYLLPPPSAVLVEMVRARDILYANAVITLQEIVGGYLLAAVVSVPIAFAIAQSRVLSRTAYPVLVVWQIVPKIALAPLFVVWFGFGFVPKIVLVFLLCFFPIVVDGIAGFRSLDPEVEEFTRTTGASRWRTFRHVRMPAALPQIFVGLRIAATFSVVAAVVAEFVASDRGLGFLLLKANGDLNTKLAIAVILVLSIIGLAIYFCVERIEAFVIPWHTSQRRADRREDMHSESVSLVPPIS